MIGEQGSSQQAAAHQIAYELTVGFYSAQDVARSEDVRLTAQIEKYVEMGIRAGSLLTLQLIAEMYDEVLHG